MLKSGSVNGDLPQLFERLLAGDKSVPDELTTGLYRELRKIANRHLSRERANHTLQATALVHETWLKLFDGSQREFKDQLHFLAIASRVMRQVLVDYARARAAQKRSSPSGAPDIVDITNLEVPGDNGTDLIELIELDDALKELSAEDENLTRLIEMRYFGGLTAEDAAEVLGISVHIVRHDLRYAHAWLRRRLDRSA
jgi:RNA polymerase sigma-70 factor (ECF subfamily)